MRAILATGLAALALTTPASAASLLKVPRPVARQAELSADAVLAVVPVARATTWTPFFCRAISDQAWRCGPLKVWTPDGRCHLDVRVTRSSYRALPRTDTCPWPGWLQPLKRKAL